MFRRWVSFWVVLSSLLLVAVNAWGQVRYTVTDLGKLNVASISAFNDSGQLVGENSDTDGHAYLYTNGQMTDLGTLGGNDSCASGINNNGQVVGYSAISSGNEHAFLYTNRTMTDIGTLGGPVSFAYGINNNGWIVGQASTPGVYNDAFLYSNGSMKDLGAPAGYGSLAKAINDNGQVAGWFWTSSNSNMTHAFLYSNGTMTDLGTLGGLVSQANGINNSGQVVGNSDSLTGPHAFLYGDGTMTDLGTLGGVVSGAYGINDSGQIVGSASVPAGVGHAFIYSNGTMTDLNSLITTPGWTLTVATAITDNGYILGYGAGPSSGSFDYFLLTPVPEPSTFVLLGIGAIGLLGYAWRRRGWARCLSGAAVVVAMLFAGSAQADVFNMGGTRNPTTGTWTGSASLEFVTVGDPGNTADTTPGYASLGYGSVGYTYQMGKYDVTVGQYCQFLNAVATTADTFGLYNTKMATDFSTIKITQSGTAGSYSYSVTGSYSQAANCPIFDVSWGDAARFCNWLQNGQPTGAEGPGTTETGAYTLNGDTTDLMTETRSATAKYVIPTLDEWYKAAYYKGGSSNAGYWAYPTKSNATPMNILDPNGANNANYSYTDSTYFLTPVGAFNASPGPYGTYDMGGNVWQWNETVISGERGFRGGSFTYDSSGLLATNGYFEAPPTTGGFNFGFRVVEVPEPGSVAMMFAITVGLFAYAYRRRRV